MISLTGKPFVGIFDGGRQQLGKFLGAEASTQIIPAGDTTWHIPRQRALAGNLLQSFFGEDLASEFIGTTPTAVEAV